MISVLLVAGLLLPFSGDAETPVRQRSSPPDTLWNSARALELLERGRAARAGFRASRGLESYQALGEGHIYFYADPEGGEEPLLIRVDQVAVELHWMAPDHTRQIIVGQRDERRLPVRDFAYYLDRLSVVQNGFGDVVQVGQGLDVAGAPHPLALGPVRIGGSTLDARDLYDARLVDSVSVAFPGRAEPVTLYQVEVRPRDPGVPALIGSLFLDRSSGAVVRMEFTFTPSAYTDPRTDQIRISLDHGLWDGRYWLPNEQRIRVRREMPELDLGIGTVIQAVMRVRDYQLNPPVSEAFFDGRPVVAAPRAMRESYPFREGLLDRVSEEGLETSLREVDMAEIRARAEELLHGRRPSGLPALRFHVPGLTTALSFDRTRGTGMGGGAAWTPTAGHRLRVHGGYDMAARLPRADLEYLLPNPADGRGALRIDGWWNAERDLGLRPGSPGAFNSLASLFMGRDDRDPYRSHGGGVTWLHGDLTAGLRAEAVRPSLLRVTGSPIGKESFRAVRTVSRGVEFSLPLGVALRGEPGLGRSRSLTLELTPGVWDSGAVLRTRARFRESWRARDYRTRVALDLEGYGAWGDRPLHHAVLLGGRGTTEGWAYRTLASHQALLGSLRVSRDLHPVWLRLHGGFTAAAVPQATPGLREAWAVPRAERFQAGATLGVGLFYDLIRVEAARGLGGGRWSLLIRPDPAWWDRL